MLFLGKATPGLAREAGESQRHHVNHNPATSAQIVPETG